MAEQTRAYKLKAFPTNSKSEIARYGLDRGKLYLKKLLSFHLFDGGKISTKGQGQLFNQMSRQAQGKAKAIKASSKETGNKWNIPENPKVFIPCKLEPSKKTSFDYWVVVPNQWEKSKVVRIPAKGHKALNKALKNHWELTGWAHLQEDGSIIVHVSKERPKVEIPTDVLGVDVGMRRAITTSDGFSGKNLRKIIREDRRSQRERNIQRTVHKQEIPYKKGRTKIKQELNRHAKDCINRVKGDPSLGIALESSLILANLKSGKLQGWARNHFSNRLRVLGQENGVFVVGVNPAYTSQECPTCRAKGERTGIWYRCKNEFCKEHMTLQNSDLVGALNIRSKGRAALGKILLKKSGAPSLGGRA